MQDIGGGGVDQEKRLVALLVPTNGAQMEHEIKILGAPSQSLNLNPKS
jgi:hypothetical protein